MDIRKQESKHHLGFLLLGLGPQPLPPAQGTHRPNHTDHQGKQAARPPAFTKSILGCMAGQSCFLGGCGDP